MKKLKVWVRRNLRRSGFDFVRYRDPMVLLASLIKEAGFQSVLDVGANRGDYSEFIRKAGFGGHIVAFEPLRDLYLDLSDRFSTDSLWSGYQLALGNRSGEADVHVASNGGASSSLLEMEERHKSAAPSVRLTSRERVNVTTLVQFLEETCYPNPMFLKLDTQGTELDILLGAEALLGTKILGVQVELSVVPLYRNGCRMGEVVGFLEGKGFHSIWGSPGFMDIHTGELLQLDIVFLHQSLIASQEMDKI